MKNKWHKFWVSFHNVYRVVGYIITLGGFLLIVVGATKAQGFPNGFIGGLVIGSIFALVSWLRFRNSYSDAVEARERYFTDLQIQRVSRRLIAMAAIIIALVVLAILVILLLSKVFSVW